MAHVVLLGDSILDNAAYADGGPAVIDQVGSGLPAPWRASLRAVDGSTTDDIPDQLIGLPEDASHLVLSIGGNNALLRVDVLETPTDTSGEAFLLLHGAAREFETAYRVAVDACLARGIPLIACTIYHGNFPDPAYQNCVGVALTTFNDAIIRIAIEKRLRVIDLRLVCRIPEDFANPLEPSVVGRAKIAASIVRAVTEPPHAGRGAHVVAT